MFTGQGVYTSPYLFLVYHWLFTGRATIFFEVLKVVLYRLDFLWSQRLIFHMFTLLPVYPLFPVLLPLWCLGPGVNAAGVYLLSCVYTPVAVQ